MARRSYQADYGRNDTPLRALYPHLPDDAGLLAAAQARLAQMPEIGPVIACLRSQYARLGGQSARTSQQLTRLQNGALCVVTGHQPILFGGPLYVVYKALTAILLAEHAEKLLGMPVVPIFWVAGEDHDAAELNHVWASFDQELRYPLPEGQASGRHIITQAILELPPPQAFVRAYYSPGRSWGDAFAAYLHHLLGERGLLVLQADEPALKRAWAHDIARELIKQDAFEAIETQTNELRALGYKQQLVPRPLNLFFLEERGRYRLERQPDGHFRLVDTPYRFSLDDLLAQVESHPERFSPNAALRPVFQQSILPNIAYVGGWGELAYWLQLPHLFRTYGLPFPVLWPRGSATLVPPQDMALLASFGLEAQDILGSDLQLRRKLARHYWQPDALQNFGIKMDGILDELLPWLQQQHSSLAANAHSLRTQLHQWQARQKHKMDRVALNQHRQELAPVFAAKNRLQPEGQVQERCLHPGALWQGDALDFVLWLEEHMRPKEWHTQLLQLP